MGRAVRKRFEDEWFGGTIDSYVHPYLKVLYEDGGIEETDVDQERLLVSGVDVDVRVQYHFGSELGWIGGSVLGRYRRDLRAREATRGLDFGVFRGVFGGYDVAGRGGVLS